MGKGNSAESISLTLTGCSFLQHAGGTKEGLCSPPAVAGLLCAPVPLRVLHRPSSQLSCWPMSLTQDTGLGSLQALRHTAISPTTLEVRAWPHTSRPAHSLRCISGESARSAPCALNGLEVSSKAINSYSFVQKYIYLNVHLNGCVPGGEGWFLQEGTAM